MLATGALLAESLPALAGEARVVRFADRWKNDLDRVWLRPEVWAGPMQDWRIRSGRLECFRALPGRNVQVLTVQHNGTPGTFSMRVRLGRLDGTALDAGEGSAGFRIGILGTLGDDPALRDYRNNLAFSGGLDAGFTAQGGLFFGDVRKADSGIMNLSGVNELLLEVLYTLRVPSSSFKPHTFAAGRHTLRISDPDSGRSRVLSGVEARAGSNGDRIKVTLPAHSG